MIHPHTCIRHINDEVGYGVFATAFIPKGTITYVKDEMELVIGPEAYAASPPVLQAQIEKYSYIDEQGQRIVSWDLAKYVNHACSPNTMSCGYGFELAIRDIQPGEQLTDEYGIFNLAWEFFCACGHPECRQIVRSQDFDQLYPLWDQVLRPALQAIPTCEQPLYALLGAAERKELEAFLQGLLPYRSVYALRHHSPNGNDIPSILLVGHSANGQQAKA